MAEWSPFGKELLGRFAVCSLCVVFICDFWLFSTLVSEGGALVLIASVPGQCLPSTFDLTGKTTLKTPRKYDRTEHQRRKID